MTQSARNPHEKARAQGVRVCPYSLVLLNDDVNAYHYVVETLIQVCGHNPLQAEQCTLIAHHTGRCHVKNGELAELQAMREGLCQKGLSSLIVER